MVARAEISRATLNAPSLILAGALAVVVVLASTALALVVLVRLPATYFIQPRRGFMEGNHPLLRASAIFAKNLLGVVLVVAGIGLSLPGVPGPGIVTLLVGLALLDFPGKRALERRVIRQPRVLAALNALRKRFAAPPLIVEEPGAPRAREGGATR